MTSVQDYLRELRAARKEFAAGSKPGTAATTTEQHIGGSPAISRSAASPWLKSPAVSKPLPSAPVRDGGGGEPALVRQGAGRGRPSVAPANSPAVRGTGRAAVAPAPGRPSPGAAGARGGEGRSPARPVKPSAAAGGRTPPEDADSDTDISHLIDQLSLKSPAKAAAPRRGSKMEMLRRKFSTSSPTKSWADLGSSGGSLSRPRARSSVSIRDEKIILSGISGDEADATDSAPEALSSGDSSSSSSSSSSSVPTERAAARRASSSSSILTEPAAAAAADASGAASVSSSIRTESASVGRRRTLSSADVPEELSRTITSVPTGPSAGTDDSDSKSDSDSDSESASEPDLHSHPRPQAQPQRECERERGREREQGTGTESEDSTLQEEASDRSARRELSPLSRKPAGASGEKSEPSVPTTQSKHVRSAKRASGRHGARAKRDRPSSSDHRPASAGKQPHEEARAKPASTKRQHAERTSRNRGDPSAERGSHGGDRRKPSREARVRPASDHERRRRRRQSSWPDAQDRTDASESLVVSYQRRVAYSTSRDCLFVDDDGDDEPVITAMLVQQIALTRHFLATQQRLRDAHSRLLRQTQRQLCTGRHDLKR
ncbi:suppressor protein SRP40-like [Pollicipes pollicipes]|uniref:suppressor protein SRP40-like n=1 Tax=Pollicipes pollicipes TaxID=41117 RepID=UPI001884AAB7|nr:suppressor protein SRP40-like [Pollicipes pollicipes]